MDHGRRRSRPPELEPIPPGIKDKSWFKDRVEEKLPSRYFENYKGKPKFNSFLNSRNWVFVKEGLDDFRRGCPPCGDTITRGPKESIFPVIYRTTPKPAPKSCRTKVSRNSTLFSKLSSAQLARKAYVEEVEARLKGHPLASCPDLEDSMPPELLKGVLEVLDPERQLKDTWAFCEDGKKRTKGPTEVLKNRSMKACTSLPKLKPVPKPDDWLAEIFAEEDLPQPPPIPKNLTKSIARFCKWVDSFEVTGIDQEYIMNKFDPGSEWKPKSIFKGQIKKVTQVPSELMQIQKPNDMQVKTKFSLQKPYFEEKLQELRPPDEKKHVKTRFGAWYLHPKLWKKLRVDEPLLDPKAPQFTEDGCFIRIDKEPDILEELYGTIAFKDFILDKGYSMPSIIERLFQRKGWGYDKIKIPKILSTKVSRVNFSEEDDEEEG